MQLNEIRNQLTKELQEIKSVLLKQNEDLNFEANQVIEEASELSSLYQGENENGVFLTQLTVDEYFNLEKQYFLEAQQFIQKQFYEVISLFLERCYIYLLFQRKLLQKNLLIINGSERVNL